MAILPILEIPDPRLRQVSKPVEAVDDALRTLIDDMFETMYDAPGIGLAAIQVGAPKRLMVVDLQEETDAEGKPIRRPMVFINPVLSEPSEEKRTYNEGCLSIPEYYAEVERPASVRAVWEHRHQRPVRHLHRSPAGCPHAVHRGGGGGPMGTGSVAAVPRAVSCAGRSAVRP